MSLLAFDIGGYSVKYGQWDKDLINTGSFKTPETWEEMKENMLNVFSKYNGIRGIALSTPGSFDKYTGMITGTSSVDYLKGFDIMEELDNMFDLPITIENDANCAARAELWRGVAKHVKNIRFVIIGSRINGAVVVDGRVQRGHNLAGGEFGHIILEKKKTYNELLSPVKLAEEFSLSKGNDKDAFSGYDLFELAKEGDSQASQIVDKFYDNLALALYNLQFTIDPSMIVLGGGISQEEDLAPEINQRIHELLVEQGLSSMDINVRTCFYEQNANLVGAIASFSHQKGGEFWDIQ